MNTIDIAIADDHTMIISGIISLLQNCKHINVVGAYPNAAALLEGLKQKQPQVLLLDILLPDQSGKDLAPLIKATYPQVEILVLTSLDAPALVGGMLRRGCRGYLLKGAGALLLQQAIECVSYGKEFIDPLLKEQFVRQVIKFNDQIPIPLLVPELTQREKEILQLIASEYSTKQISEKLFISQRTAENHRYNLMQKLDVKNTVGLVKIAIQLGLV